MPFPANSRPTEARDTGRGALILPAILLVLAAMAIVPVMDGIAKYLSATYATIEIVWARYIFHFLILSPIVFWRYGVTGIAGVPHKGLQVLRGLFLLLGTALFFAGLRWLPLADTLALFFISPMVVTGLAPFVLGERVGVRRWSAVLIGFLGALVIIRPGFGVFQWASLLGVGSGFCYAGYILTTRKLSGRAPAAVTLWFTALVGVVIMTVLLPSVWIPPQGLFHWGLMIAMGAIAVVAHFLLILAYERAPAPQLAPFAYSEMIMATMVGYLVFGDFPDPWTWVGMAIIVASGVYITLREKPRKPVLEPL